MAKENLKDYNKLSWDEVYTTLSEIELLDKFQSFWFYKAWSIIENNGYANFSNDIELHKVYFRLISLCEIYREFYSEVQEMTYYFEYTDWLDELTLNPIRIGQMIGQSFELAEYDTDTLEETSIMELVSQFKHEVIMLLKDAYGGSNSLFVSMWLNFSTDAIYLDGLGYIDELELDEEIYDIILKHASHFILNDDISLNKMRVYDWFISN